jgi:hypothetical protein
MCCSTAIGTSAFLAMAWAAFALDLAGLFVGGVAAGLPYWMITDSEVASKSATARLHNNTAVFASGLWITAVLVTPPRDVKSVMIKRKNETDSVEVST